MEDQAAKKYTRTRRILAELSFLAWAAVLLLLCFFRNNVFFRFASHTVQNYYFGILIYWSFLYVVTSISTLPFGVAQFWVEHRYSISKQSVSSWLTDYTKLHAIGFITGAAAVEYAYFVIQRFPSCWWVLFWAGLVGYLTVFTLLLPSLVMPWFARISPLPEGELKDKLSALAHRAGLASCRLGVLHVAQKTRRANALITGLGGTRQILLTDTLLENHNAAEIEAITAHEIGHEVLHHIPKRIAILSALYLVALSAGPLLISPWVTAISDVTYLPILLLTFRILKVYISLVFVAFARRQEKSADLFCWHSIEDVNAYISAMKKLNQQNMITYERGQQWAYGHPALASRIAEAEKFLAQKSADAVATSEDVTRLMGW